MSALRLSLALFLWAAAACTDEAPPFVPPSFERADQLALACMDVVTAQGLPLAECDVDEPSSDLHLLALVTQSQRGELAVVDLSEDEIIDVDRSVPGYTFHPVGELPTAVAVSPDGTRAFVASSGARSIAVFDVGTIGLAAGRLDPIDLGAHAPFDVVADDGRLFVTAPDEGLLLVVDTDAAEITAELPLEAGGAGGGVEPDAGPEDAGPGDGGAGDGGAGDAGSSDGGADAGAVEDVPSRPWRMALDADARRLYVANAGRDGISVVDVDGLVELEPLPSGAPTASLAVSPAREDGDGTRFVYAVESEGGGVRVIDLPARALVDASRGTYERGGETISYSDPDEPGPAIRVPGMARGVEFFERSSDAEAAPEVLDGVFAAILSSNGALYVVDVEDDHREARAENPDEQSLYVFLPHHLRSLRRFTDGELPRLSGNAIVQVASSQVICSTDYGFVGHFFAEGGAPPCDDAGLGIVVDRTNPWIGTDETWTVTYEGTLPGTVRPRGNLEGDDEVLDRVADFCALGVQPGDLFVLESPVTGDAPEECGQQGEAERRWTIADVLRDRLVLEDPFGFEPSACGLDGWVSYRIRTSGEWTVVGTTTGFEHAIVVGEDGRCVRAEGADPRRTGRAPQCDADELDDEDRRAACAFAGATLAFTMVRGVEAGSPVATQPDTSWAFTTTGAIEPLAIAIGSLPTSIRYLPGRDRFFAVDPIEAGLVEVSLTSLAPERSFR